MGCGAFICGLVWGVEAFGFGVLRIRGDRPVELIGSRSLKTSALGLTLRGWHELSVFEVASAPKRTRRQTGHRESERDTGTSETLQTFAS